MGWYLAGWEAKGFNYHSFAYTVRSFCLSAGDVLQITEEQGYSMLLLVWYCWDKREYQYAQTINISSTNLVYCNNDWILEQYLMKCIGGISGGFRGSGSMLDCWSTGPAIDPAPGSWFITKLIVLT